MTDFEEYVDMYGYHFSKKLYEWAVKMMRDRNGNPVPPKTKEQVTELLRVNGVTLGDSKGYDEAYVLAMATADYWGSSISDDRHLALYVKDYLEDPDGYAEKAFDCFVMSCRAKGDYIFWDEFL